MVRSCPQLRPILRQRGKAPPRGLCQRGKAEKLLWTGKAFVAMSDVRIPHRNTCFFFSISARIFSVSVFFTTCFITWMSPRRSWSMFCM